MVTGCFRIETYPPEPQIEFISFTYSDSTDLLGNHALIGVLRFSFVDGDGDIGFEQSSDPTMEDSLKTIFIKKYIKANGIYEEVLDSISLNFRVPYITPDENNPVLKGEIMIGLNEYPPFDNDTVKYSFYIVDRAGNKSNVAETGDLILEDYLTTQ